MIGRLVAAAVGAEVGRSRGAGGAKGAVAGLVAAAVLRRMGPLGVVVGGAYVAKKAIDRARAGRGA